MKKFRFTALAVVGCFVFFLFGRTFFAQDKYSGSVVKTKILDFYNELIWWIGNRV